MCVLFFVKFCTFLKHNFTNFCSTKSTKVQWSFKAFHSTQNHFNSFIQTKQKKHSFPYQINALLKAHTHKMFDLIYHIWNYLLNNNFSSCSIIFFLYFYLFCFASEHFISNSISIQHFFSLQLWIFIFHQVFSFLLECI